MCTEKSTEKPADMMRQIMDTKSKLIDSTDMQPNTPRYIEMIMRQMRNTACKKGWSTRIFSYYLETFSSKMQGHSFSLSTYGNIEQ